MTIITPGHVREPEPLFGRCSRCGCQFRCALSETEVAFDPYWREGVQHARCPQCQQSVTVREEWFGHD